MHRCRQRFRSDDLDVAADRFGRDAAAVGDPDLQVRVAGNRGAGQPAHALAAAVDGDVAGHGLGLDPAVQAAAQVDAAADGLRFDVSGVQGQLQVAARSEEHTSELQSLMRISYAVFCLKKKINTYHVT